MDDLTMLEAAFQRLGKGDVSALRRWIVPRTTYEGNRKLKGSRILATFKGLLDVTVVKAHARRMNGRELQKGDANRGFVVVLTLGPKTAPIIYDLWFDDYGKLTLIKATNAPI